MAESLDPRLTPARPDVADIRLRGRVTAERFVAAAPRRVVAPAAPLRRAPSPEAGLDTEALLGDAVDLYAEQDGFAFVQLVRDGYVGYLPADEVRPHVLAAKKAKPERLPERILTHASPSRAPRTVVVERRTRPTVVIERRTRPLAPPR